MRFSMMIVKAFYHSIWNLMYYYRERKIPGFYVASIKSITSDMAVEDSRRVLTDVCLATVGLKTVDNDKDAVPRYVMLSAFQKTWVQLVSDQGFKVGLINKHKIYI
jgi:hypothetical protein